ncbi:hypothetical protein SDC9_144789 [bioreactor metagenome]|uniref:Uncharacterized protein n=1 Tax=bioreactor metagenome TaxID=1076179 RepID=A0A645E701_9ZZZZ
MVKLFLILLNSVIKTFRFDGFIHLYVTIIQLNDLVPDNISHFY